MIQCKIEVLVFSAFQRIHKPQIPSKNIPGTDKKGKVVGSVHLSHSSGPDWWQEWLAVQKNWLYLEPIFQSEDIMRQLPSEAKRFATVNKIWRTLLGVAHENPYAPAWLTLAPEWSFDDPTEPVGPPRTFQENWSQIPSETDPGHGSIKPETATDQT